MMDEIIKKRALRVALALAVGVLVYRNFSFTQGFWIPLTIIIVIQPTLSSTLRKGLQRFVGTIIGILLGSVIVIWVQQSWQVDGLLVLTLFIAYYLKSFNLVNYGIFVIPLTAMVVMLVSVLVPKEAADLIIARCIDTTIGAFIAVFMSFIFLPISHKKVIKKGVEKVDGAITNYTKSLMKPEPNVDDIAKRRLQLQSSLACNREYYHDSFYEHLFNQPLRNSYKKFVLQAEKLSQLLFGMDDLMVANKATPPNLQTRYQAKIALESKRLQELTKESLACV